MGPPIERRPEGEIALHDQGGGSNGWSKKSSLSDIEREGEKVVGERIF